MFGGVKRRVSIWWRAQIIGHLVKCRSVIRQTSNESNDATIEDAMLWYTNVTAMFLEHLSNQIKESDNSGVWRLVHLFHIDPERERVFLNDIVARVRYLIGFKNLLRAIECYGIASVYGIRYLGQGNLTKDTYVMYVRNDFLARDLLQGSLNYVPSLKPMFDDLTKNETSNYVQLKKWFVSHKTQISTKYIWIYSSFCRNRNEMMLKNEKRATIVQEAINYFDTMTMYMEEVRKLQKELRRLIA